MGKVGGKFEYNRQALLAWVGRAAAKWSLLRQGREARELADSVQRSVAQTALVEVGAVGLGALLVTLLATALADVTGVLAAGVFAALGFYVLPNKRRQAKNNLQAKIIDLPRASAKRSRAVRERAGALAPAHP